MAYLPPPGPAIRKKLRDSPEVLKKLEAKHRHELDKEWPKPDPDEVLKNFEDLHTEFAEASTVVNLQRDLRYQRDRPPAKLQKRMGKDQDRVFTRLSHNEVMRTAATATRNGAKFRVPAKGSGETPRKRAQKQTRWLNQLFPALWRRTGHDVYRDVADKSFGDGLGAWEIYLTDAYDKLDLAQESDESDKDFLNRTEDSLQGARLPFGVRTVDRLSLFYEEDEDDGVAQCYIVERKKRRQANSEVKRKMGEEKYTDWQTKGAASTPRDAKKTEQSTDAECIRWYDQRWYCYWVDGKLVEGPLEHQIPGGPIILVPGLVTGSSNLSERFQGVSWGTSSLEKALNDLLTLELANALDFGRPKVGITSPADSRAMPRRPNGEPPVLNLADSDAVPYLEPGQLPVDIYQNFVPKDTSRIQGTMMALFERNGQNPINQGQSPGADPAGYVVNSLQSAANTLYEPAIDNLAMATGMLGDKIRLLIRDTIRLPVYLSNPMSDKAKGGTEWLALGPDDIDETPCDVTIDPLSDVNRIALQQSLRQGNKEGYVPRRLVQERGYNAEDAEEWDDELIEDSLEADLGAMAKEEAKAQIFAAQLAQQQLAASQAAAAGAGMPMTSAVPPAGDSGAMAGPLNPPAVGADMAAASTRPFEVQPGPAPLPTPTGNAGQGTNYTPPGVA